MGPVGEYYGIDRHRGIDGESGFLFILIHVGALDDTEIQVRPVDAYGLAYPHPIGIGEYAGNRSGDIISTEWLAFLV